MKTPIITILTLIVSTQISYASPVEDCKARAALNHSHEIRELRLSKSNVGADKRFLIDRSIQNLEVQVLAEQAACEEESRYPTGDEKFSTRLTEEDFTNGDLTLIHSEE